MSSFGRSRDFLVYLAVLIPYQAIRLMPYPVVKGMARLCGGTMNLIPSIRNLVRANIRTAFPEYSETEVARIGQPLALQPRAEHGRIHLAQRTAGPDRALLFPAPRRDGAAEGTRRPEGAHHLRESAPRQLGGVRRHGPVLCGSRYGRHRKTGPQPVSEQNDQQRQPGKGPGARNHFFERSDPRGDESAARRPRRRHPDRPEHPGPGRRQLRELFRAAGIEQHRPRPT